MLIQFFIKACFKIGRVDDTLFIQEQQKEIIIVQYYVDDIIFSSTTQYMFCENHNKRIWYDERLSCFLGLQFKQMNDEIFVNQSTYMSRTWWDDSGYKPSKVYTIIKLSWGENCKKVDEKIYREMIGSPFTLQQVHPTYA